MSFSSITRLFDRKQRANRSVRAKRRQTRRVPEWLRPHVPFVQILEDRTLLAVIPPAQLTGLAQLSPGGARDNYNTPAIAVNPLDSQKMATAWIWNCDEDQDCTDESQHVFVQAIYSKDGGVNFDTVALPSTLLDPTTLGDQAQPFDQVTDVSVAWDRSDQLYFVYSQHTDDYTTGIITLQKFELTPEGDIGDQLIENGIVYRWSTDRTLNEIGEFAALNPTMVIDNTLPTYTDPQSGATQTNPNVGTIYVAWNTNEPQFQNAPPNFNPQSIKITASVDGGLGFGAPLSLNANGNVGDRHSFPKIVVSQGTGSAVVPGGQVTVVWDDFGPAVNPPPGLDFILTRRAKNGGSGTEITCSPRLQYPGDEEDCGEIIHPANEGDTVINEFTLNASFPAGFGTNVRKMNVFLNIDSNALPGMKATLISPTNVTYTLFFNHEDENGNTFDGVGLQDSPLGVIKYADDAPGIPWDTIFDTSAPYAINDELAQGPYIGYFRPEGNFPSQISVANATGPWTLRIETFTQIGEDEMSILSNWGINFLGEFTLEATSRVIDPLLGAPPTLRGAPLPTQYPTKQAYAPETGIGATPVIASDNTLGSFSPFKGRLYVAYTGRLDPATLPNNTDIVYFTSDDGGVSWSLRGIINDDRGSDGFSTGTRPQIQPNLVVDPYTGTVVASFLDFRYDPAQLRYVNTVTASIDGGQTWSKQTWLDPSISAPDTITGKNVVLQPIPGNQSDGNETRDQVFNIGDHQALAVVQGKIFALWGTNLNGGRSPNPNDSADQNTWLRQQVLFASATINAGPVIIDSTMGPAEGVNVSGFVFNNTFTPQGIPIVDGFAVTFDRRVDPGSFTTAAIQVKYRSYDPLASFVNIPVNQVIPLNTNSLGATTFFIHFTTPQFATGTYSYVVLPIVRDRIRHPDGGLGNFMDQNSNSIAGQPATQSTGGDSYAAPTPNANGPNFLAPYDRDTLPIIVPGPYIVKTNVAGNPQTVDNVVINKYVTSIDVTFDRDMQPGSIAPATILRMYGVVGSINGPFTVTPNPLGTDPDPNFPRTYRIGFPEQKVSGTYTITFASSPKAKGGRELDTNKNAGVDILFQKPTAGTEPKTYANGTDFFIGPNATVVSTINVPDGFVIQGTTIGDSATPGFDINFPDVRFLSAKLVAPDGTEILLFTKPGGNHPPPYNDVKGTILDDNAVTPQGGTNPIQSGSAPFGGRYNPQQPLSVLTGKLSSGTYRLILTNSSPTLSGTLNAWSLVLQKAISLTGLGEPVADQATVSFRTFNVAKNLPISQQAWTAVGPASNNNNANSSRISGIAVDPSDPSANTVYVAGASGGVWKTSNFMTDSPIGPTWIPLLDYGPVWSMNVGGIAVFGRNNDPKQSMVFVSTGEGDTGSIGAGIMRSMDGGATWTQLDSTDNTLPFAQRDHRFRDATSFKIIVDPKPSPVGPNQAVVYAVINGTDSANELTVQGGIWKSVDSGAHWFRLTPAPNQLGYANPTDLVFVPSSGDANTGNLRLAYAAWRGKGVYISSNGGSGWNLLVGKFGNPLIRDPDNNPIPVADPPSDPNGDDGRIVLATPALSGSKAQDLSYQGWVYAYVMNQPTGSTKGFYVSKDFGQNWTKVKIAAADRGVYGSTLLDLAIVTTDPDAVPSNDDTLPDVEQMNSNQGNYDVSIAVNPLNPNIVYLGGQTGAGNETVIRVDLTGIADPHNLTAFNNFRNDGGKLWFQSEGSITLANPNEGKPYGFFPVSDPPDAPWLNLFRDPFSPFANPSTLNVGNPDQATLITGFTNTGIRSAIAPWYPIATYFGPYDQDVFAGSVDQHRVISMIDPLTGHARLIFGDDQGIFTMVERDDGTLSTGVGTARTPIGPRNGNLQINQFYGGATQPSQGAADKGGSMFYGASQDNGATSSDKDILKNGNLQWTGPGGDASWVQTDQTGAGTVFHWWWPCCGGANNETDTFRVNGVSHTVGLFQTPNDPQWPDGGDCCRFAVNPINPDQVVIASAAGRVFRTGGLPGGYTWFVIGEPQDSGGPFDDDVFAKALAFGAPDPSDPTQQTDNHIYIGNDAGNIFVTFDGGGHWIKFTTADGLDGSPVQSITTNPKRGTREAYAVTQFGIYWMKDSAAPGARWENVTGNVFASTHNPFGDPGLMENRLKILSSIVGDWRYSILDNPNQPNGLTHPVLYVAGTAGVFRSLDKGVTWTNFPNVAQDGAPAKGGYLPNAEITRIELSLGNINPVTGFPDAATSEDMLVAHTYGRGSWMIRLKPINPIEQAFVRGLDAQIYAQKVDANGNPVGGYFLTAPGTFQSFVVGRGPNKYPQLFAMGGDNQVYTQKFDGSGNSAGPWTLTAGGVFKSVVTGNLPSGALQIFTVGFDNQVYSLKFDVSGNPVGGFFATQPLAVKQLVVGRDSINRPQLFAVGQDNQVYTQKFGKQGNSASPWILTSPAQFKSVQVGNDLSGRPETFVIGFDDNVYYQKYDSNGLPIGNYLPLPQKFVSHVVVGHDALNNPQVFVRGRDDQTVYSLKLDANGNPTGGYFLASPGQVKTLDVGYDLNNIPELFVIGLDDQIYYATFFANGQPAAPYKLLSPGKVLGLKVTK